MKISVVVICYNQGKYIRECLNSVINISYDDYEVIIVDDGSTDDSALICKEFATKYDNVSYIYEDNSGGAAAPRNNGIEHASGEYIIFVDGDDMVEPDILTILSGIVEERDDVDIAIGGYLSLDGNNKIPHSFFTKGFSASTVEEKEKLYLQLMDGSYDNVGDTAVGVSWARLYSLNMINSWNLRFQTDMRRLEDNVFNMYAFKAARNIVCVSNPVYDYRLEHIRKLNGEDQDSLQKMIQYRKNFLETSPEYDTEKIRAYQRNEAMSYLINGINELIDLGRQSEIADFCNLSVYKKILNDDVEDVSRKYQLYVWVLRHRQYWLICIYRALKMHT